MPIKLHVALLASQQPDFGSYKACVKVSIPSEINRNVDGAIEQVERGAFQRFEMLL